MGHDSLATVLALRRRAVDMARAAVVGAIHAGDRAEDLVQARTRQIEEERRRASDPAGGDELVDAFAAWLPEGRRQLAAARAEQERLLAELARRRAELSRTEVALETVQTLVDGRARDAAVAEQRRSQQLIDEAASRRTPGPLP